MPTSAKTYLTAISTLAGGTGTWANATVARLKADDALYAVWTKPAGTGQTSPGLECSGFGTFPSIKSDATITNVVVEVNCFVSSTSYLAAYTYELWDGTSAIIGTAKTGTSSTSASKIDTLTFTGVTYAQLATLRLRIYGHGGATSTTGTGSVDYVRMSVNYANQILATDTFPGTTWAAQWALTLNGGTASCSGNVGTLLSQAGSWADGICAYLTGMDATIDTMVACDIGFKSPIQEEYVILMINSDGTFNTNIGASNNGYFIQFNPNPGVFRLSRMNGGTETILQNVSYTFTSGVRINVVLQRVAAVLKVWVWDVGSTKPTSPNITVTDGTPYNTAGKVWLFASNGNAATAESASFANLTVTDGALLTVVIPAFVGWGVPLKPVVLPVTATPTFSPVAGTYSTTQNVTISCSTPGSVIYYTTDGSTPTSASPTYSTPISVSVDGTLKAMAMASGYTDSAVGTAAYTISAFAVTRFFADTSLWNTVKTNPPATWYSAADATLAAATYGINDSSFSHPTYFGKSTDPTVTFTCGAGWGNPAQTITAKAPTGMTPASGSDSVMQVYLGNGGTGSVSGALPAGTLLDLYSVTGSGTAFTGFFYGLSNGDTGSGFSPSTIASMTASGTCAIGSPQAAGTILARDVTAGVIPHGLFIAFDMNAEGGYGTSPKPTGPLSPAIAYDDSGGTGPLTQGMLLLIPSSTAKPTFTSAMGGALWDAAQTYGVYVCDRLTGGPMFYGDRSVASSFVTADWNAVGRALRAVKTW